jgi:hypothetical protein
MLGLYVRVSSIEQSGGLHAAKYAGPQRFINGRLQSASLDVYIVMEFGSGGDLFNFK